MNSIFLFLLSIASAQTTLPSLPASFQWCVATAAHQVDGGDTTSDWAYWENQPGHIAHGDKAGRACDQWNRLPEDVAIMKEMGIKVYRFSVEWAKIEPEEGKFDQQAIEHFRNEVLLLKKNGIEPMITFQHFTLPQWLRTKGGWEWPGAVDSFTHFTEIVYQQIGPDVRDWITINEPMVHIFVGYLNGIFVPGEKRSLFGVYPVIQAVIKAHTSAYHKLHELAKAQGHTIRVGVAHHLRTFDPLNKWNPLDQLVSMGSDYIWNWMFLNAVAETQDFIGVNYYSGDVVQFSLPEGVKLLHREELPKNDLGWDIYPEGLARLLREVAKRYPNLPIFITENGLADANDNKRPQFILQHLQVVADAIKNKIPVEGYCHWSLLDNFEWAEGFTPRFGLYEMDYQTMQRKPRPSAKLFQQIIHQSGQPPQQ